MTHELRVERVIDAPPHVVFDAFVDADAQREWYPKPPGWVVETACDPRVGGVWTSSWGPAGQEPFRETCVFQVVDRPRRLLLASTASAPGGGTVETTQEITFDDEPGGRTRMTVVHGGFPSPALRDELLGGWPTALASLDRYVTTGATDIIGRRARPVPIEELS